MIIRRPYNFRAALAAYVLAGVAVAFLIHFIVLSSPKYRWMFPAQTTGTGTSTQVGRTSIER